MLVAVNVLVVRSNTPRASSCSAGLVALNAVVSPLMKVGKLPYTTRAVVSVVVGVVVEVFGLPYPNRGAKVDVTGRVVGTTSGLAGSDFKSMLSGPIRMTPETYAALLRLMENSAEDTTLNGVVVPVGCVQTTCRLAVSHTWLPSPQ